VDKNLLALAATYS